MSQARSGWVTTALDQVLFRCAELTLSTSLPLSMMIGLIGYSRQPAHRDVPPRIRKGRPATSTTAKREPSIFTRILAGVKLIHFTCPWWWLRNDWDLRRNFHSDMIVRWWSWMSRYLMEEDCPAKLQQVACLSSCDDSQANDTTVISAAPVLKTPTQPKTPPSPGVTSFVNKRRRFDR